MVLPGAGPYRQSVSHNTLVVMFSICSVLSGLILRRYVCTCMYPYVQIGGYVYIYMHFFVYIFVCLLYVCLFSLAGTD